MKKKIKKFNNYKDFKTSGFAVRVNKGVGVDSFDRYIYIHGTNHEDRLGKPSSSGCLQLSNTDVLDLYSKVIEGFHLWIEEI